MMKGMLEGILSGIGSVTAELVGTATMQADLTVPPSGQTNPFQGDYEYTPSGETQTIEIEGLRATRNIIINPIPNNYGLITWNGSTLTVS